MSGESAAARFGSDGRVVEAAGAEPRQNALALGAILGVDPVFHAVRGLRGSVLLGSLQIRRVSKCLSKRIFVTGPPAANFPLLSPGSDALEETKVIPKEDGPSTSGGDR